MRGEHYYRAFPPEGTVDRCGMKYWQVENKNGRSTFIFHGLGNSCTVAGINASPPGRGVRGTVRTTLNEEDARKLHDLLGQMLYGQPAKDSDGVTYTLTEPLPGWRRRL